MEIKLMKEIIHILLHCNRLILKLFKMKTIKFFNVVVFLLSFGLISNAQTKLILKEKSGITNSIIVNNIRSITFPTNNISINKIDESSDLVLLSDVRSLSFSDIISSVQVKNTNDFQFLFPNPVNDKFQITSSEFNLTENNIEIFDLQGKCLLKQNFNIDEAINVEKLEKGVYLCRIQNKNNIQTIKFLKQ
jgi:hypothetical protein